MKAGFFAVPAPLATVLFSVVLAAGCAVVPPATPDAIVKERSQARWNALLKGDTKAAYAFLSPGSRAVLTQEDYSTSIRQGFWKSAAVEKVACASPDSCEAQVAVEYEHRGIRTKTPVRETWIREGSDWWYVQK